MTGRERVENVCSRYFSACSNFSGRLHDEHYITARDAIASDLDTLAKAQEAAEKYERGDYGDDLAEFACDLLNILRKADHG